jgi:hypothetical protein
MREFGQKSLLLIVAMGILTAGSLVAFLSQGISAVASSEIP